MGARFDGVLFDAGGVLVLPDPTVLGPTLAPHGGSLDVVVHHRAHYASMRAHDIADDEDLDWRAYNEAYLRWTGVSDDDPDAAQIFAATMNPFLWRFPNPGAASVLRALVDRGVPVGVVSNASGQIEAALARAGLCQVGDGPGAAVVCVVDSHVVGFSKPDPRIFEGALGCLGVAPERVVYVGDSARYDVRGALAAGLTPVQLDPYEDTPDADHERVVSLEALLAWV
jgi:putative hydrolase of the HAD superfamily